MGLDQYLSVKRYVSKNLFDPAHRTSQPNEKYNEVLVASGLASYDGTDWCGANVEVVAIYWRKANAIHQWFVDNCADGADNCKPVTLYLDSLEELLRVCKETKAEPHKASELLPTSDGFFFGSTDYDDWYWEDLDRTIVELTALIDKLKEESLATYELIYFASW
jgi:hypothetical protein